MVLAGIYKNPIADHLSLLFMAAIASSALYFSVRALFTGFFVSPGSFYGTAKPARYWTWVLIYGFIGSGLFSLLYSVYYPNTFHRLF
jgi:hypothetical protein